MAMRPPGLVYSCVWLQMIESDCLRQNVMELFYCRRAIYQLFVVLLMIQTLSIQIASVKAITPTTTSKKTSRNFTTTTSACNTTSPRNETNAKTAALLSKRQLYYIKIVTMTLSVTGALFNTAVIVAIIIDPLKILRKGPSWITIFNLAIADFISCISNFCIWGRGFFHQSHDSTYMHTSYFGWGFGASASIFFLTFLAAQVYIVTKFPLIMRSRRIITNARIALSSIVIWLISFVLGLSQIAYLRYSDLHTILKIYAGRIGTLELVLVVQITLSILIIIETMKSRRRVGNNFALHNRHRHIAKVVIILSLILFIAAFPYFVFKQMEYFARLGYFGESETARWSRHMCYIYLPITMLNFTANPILYSLRLPEYKKSLLAFINRTRTSLRRVRSHSSVRMATAFSLQNLRKLDVLSPQQRKNNSTSTCAPPANDQHST